MQKEDTELHLIADSFEQPRSQSEQDAAQAQADANQDADQLARQVQEYLVNEGIRATQSAKENRESI